MNTKDIIHVPHQSCRCTECVALPFRVVPMPINADGHGPEMDEDRVVKTVYQVWDAVNEIVGEFNTEIMAKLCVRSLNAIYAER